MIKLVLTDLDDTLIPVGAPSASERARAAVHALLAHGIHFGPVSGRLPTAMGWMFAGDEACFQTGAFSNGQILHLDGREVGRKELSAEALRQVEDILDKEGDAALAIYPVEGDGRAILYTEDPGRLEELPSLLSESTGEVRRTIDADASYVKANVHVAGDLSRRIEVRDLLRREVPALAFVFPSMVAPLIDISPAGWDKGTAVRSLAEAVGADLEEVVCFGDSENDLPMLEAVPNGVAVANAAEEVKDMARWHIGASRDDAVGEALEEIVRAAELGGLPAFMRG